MTRPLAAGRGDPTTRRIDAAAAVGAAIVAIAVIAAVLGPSIVPYAPRQIVGTPYQQSNQFLLGADVLGRDVFSRLIAGTRLTLVTALGATCLGFLLGAGFGMIVAMVRGFWDDAATWLVDVLLSFPPLMLSLLIVSALSSNLYVLIATIGLIQAPRVARVSRTVALGIAAMPFVEASRARGERAISLLWRDVLPNCLQPLFVEFGLRLTYSILFISGLSFLGLGIQPPDADWGSLVRENLGALVVGTYAAALAPALAIAVLSVAINLLVDWMSRQSSPAIPEELL